MIFETADFTEGKRVLNMYYSYVPTAARPWDSFSECLEWYMTDHYLKEKYPSDSDRWGNIVEFIETLGRNSKILNNSAKLMTALKRVASETTKTKAPNTWTFGQALVNSAQSLTFDDVKKATKEGLIDATKAVATTASLGLGVYLAILTVIFLVPYFLQKRGKLA